MKNLPQIEAIYHSALELPPHERESFVRQMCGEDEELRREIESLLSFDERAAEFIESPPEDIAADFFVSQNEGGLVGKEFNHYRILSPIGKGGMGEVYLAEDTKLKRKIALKVLPLQFSQDAERKSRFEQEARAISALNHPNIITIHGIEETENLNFIATEFIEGQTLRERISQGKISWQETAKIGTQIAGALESAHSVGIIHRDIKPANIMIRDDGYVKVLDFGLAKLVNEEWAVRSKGKEKTPHSLISAPHSKAGAVMGTLNYMSPEQALGEKLDARTDIFSLGVVLYEMLSGVQPFKGTSDAAVYNATLNENPPSLFEINSDIPFELNRIIKKALEKDRGDRYQTATDLREDLQKLRENSYPTGS